MASIFRGNTNSSVQWINGSLPVRLASFGLVNNESTGIELNVYLINGASEVRIAPANLAINQGEMYEGTRPTILRATEIIKLTTNGSTDYDFVMSNISNPEI